MANIAGADQDFQDAQEKFVNKLKEYEAEGERYARSVTIRRNKKGELIDFVVNFTIFKDNIKEQME